MKSRIIFSSIAALLLLGCGTPKNEPKTYSSSESTVSREHCLSKDNNASCFLEIESNGKSTFYAPERDYQYLMTNQALAEMNIPLKELATSDYAELVNKHTPPTIVYDEGSIDKVEAYANSGAGDSPAMNGWWDSWGRKAAKILGGAISGALSGAAAGAVIGTHVPVIGNIIGAIGGGIIGAIGGGVVSAVVNGKTTLVYHYAGQKSMTQALIKEEASH